VAAICCWSIFKISPNPIAKCAQGCSAPRAGPLSKSCHGQTRSRVSKLDDLVKQDLLGGFTLTNLRHVGDQEKIIPSSVDTSSPMTAPPILPQSAEYGECALKKTDWPELDRFKFLILDILSVRRVRAELQLESQSEPMG
jgi:hypothetical protein